MPRATSHHIALLWQCLCTFVLVCMRLFPNSRGWSNAKLYETTSHPALWVWPQLTKVISQSHTDTHVHYHPSSALFVCVWWSSSVWPDMALHLTHSQGQKPGVGNAKSYFPKPTRPHPAHACTHTHAHLHAAIPCRRTWPQSQTDFLSSVWTHICFLTTIIATDRAGRGPANRCLLFDSHE